MKNKKLIISIVVLAALIVAFVGVFFTMRPKTAKGEKAYTLEVTDKNGETKKYDGRTDEEYLKGVLDEIQQNNKDFSYEADATGFVNTVNGVTADWNTDQSYWAIYVNGEYGQFGIEQQPVADQDVFSFVYTISNF